MKKQYVAPRIDLALVYALGQSVNTMITDSRTADAGNADDSVDWSNMGDGPASDPAAGPTF